MKYNRVLVACFLVLTTVVGCCNAQLEFAGQWVLPRPQTLLADAFECDGSTGTVYSQLHAWDTDSDVFFSIPARSALATQTLDTVHSMSAFTPTDHERTAPRFLRQLQAWATLNPSRDTLHIEGPVYDVRLVAVGQIDRFLYIPEAESILIVSYSGGGLIVRYSLVRMPSNLPAGTVLQVSDFPVIAGGAVAGHSGSIVDLEVGPDPRGMEYGYYIYIAAQGDGGSSVTRHNALSDAIGPELPNDRLLITDYYLVPEGLPTKLFVNPENGDVLYLSSFASVWYLIVLDPYTLAVRQRIPLAEDAAFGQFTFDAARSVLFTIGPIRSTSTVQELLWGLNAFTRTVNGEYMPLGGSTFRTGHVAETNLQFRACTVADQLVVQLSDPAENVIVGLPLETICGTTSPSFTSTRKNDAMVMPRVSTAVRQAATWIFQGRLGVYDNDGFPNLPVIVDQTRHVLVMKQHYTDSDMLVFIDALSGTIFRIDHFSYFGDVSLDESTGILYAGYHELRGPTTAMVRIDITTGEWLGEPRQAVGPDLYRLFFQTIGRYDTPSEMCFVGFSTEEAVLFNIYCFTRDLQNQRRIAVDMPVGGSASKVENEYTIITSNNFDTLYLQHVENAVLTDRAVISVYRASGLLGGGFGSTTVVVPVLLKRYATLPFAELTFGSSDSQVPLATVWPQRSLAFFAAGKAYLAFDLASESFLITFAPGTDATAGYDVVAPQPSEFLLRFDASIIYFYRALIVHDFSLVLVGTVNRVSDNPFGTQHFLNDAQVTTLAFQRAAESRAVGSIDFYHGYPVGFIEAVAVDLNLPVSTVFSPSWLENPGQPTDSRIIGRFVINYPATTQREVGSFSDASSHARHVTLSFVLGLAASICMAFLTGW
jgi:hypothetical protein